MFLAYDQKPENPVDNFVIRVKELWDIFGLWDNQIHNFSFFKFPVIELRLSGFSCQFIDFSVSHVSEVFHGSMIFPVVDFEHLWT